MLIIPYVCAEFRDVSGNPIFRITPAMRGTMITVPEAIRQDILFDMLVADGSIKVPETAAQKKTLEQDPIVGVTAEGKSETGKPAKNGKTAKKDSGADEKAAGAETAEPEQKK